MNDAPPLVTQRCWFFHKWGQWHTIETGDLNRRGTHSKVGKALVQQRVCERCKKVELNTQSVYF